MEIDITGTYAKLIPSAESVNKLRLMTDLLDIENKIAARDFHVTVLYSRVECPEVSVVGGNLPIKASGKSFDVFRNNDGSGCLVLKLDGSELHYLHQECRSLGGTHDYPEYTPHITLSYDFNTDPPSNDWLDHLNNLVFDEFVVEPLNISWSA